MILRGTWPSIVLSRAARSARLTAHFDLVFLGPTSKGYFCHKHKRTCRPVEEAQKFLARYTTDTIRRIRSFAEARTSRSVDVLHEDSRTCASLPGQRNHDFASVTGLDRLPRAAPLLITSRPIS